MSSYPDENGDTVYVCHSWESVFALAETNIREMLKFKKLLPFRLVVPQLLTPIGPMAFPSPYLFAIAWSVSVDGSNGSAGSRTWSMTTVGGDNMLFVSAFCDVAHTVSAANYDTTGANQSMALIDSSSTIYYHTTWHLEGLTNIGAVTVGVTATSSTFTYSLSVSYSGVKQTSQPRNHNITFSAATASMDSTAISVAGNSWLIGGGLTNNAGGNWDGAYLRLNTAGTYHTVYDSNGPLSAGNQVLNYHRTGALASIEGFTSEFEVIGAPGPANLKTLNTNAFANIKTLDANTLANIKTYDTIS